MYVSDSLGERARAALAGEHAEEMHTALIVRRSPGKGLGVFAAEDIPMCSDRVIVSMDSARVSRSSSWDALRRDTGIPHDSGIHCYGGKIIYDPTQRCDRGGV